MQHVRVGEDHVRALADPGPLLLRSVAVVDRVVQGRSAQLGEAAGLVLRERFGRVQVERAGPRVAREHMQHGEVEAQRLAAGRPGRDDRVAASHHVLPRVGLMGVEGGDPARDQSLSHIRVQVVGDRRGDGCLPLLMDARHQPLVLPREQPVERIRPALLHRL